MRMPNSLKVMEVFCDAGDTSLQAKLGTLFQNVIDVADEILDHADLNNVLVVKLTDGKFYVGEFRFHVREVSEEEAKAIAESFVA